MSLNDLKTICKFPGKHGKQRAGGSQHNLRTAPSLKHSLSSIKEEIEHCLKVCIIKLSVLSSVLSTLGPHIKDEMGRAYMRISETCTKFGLKALW
jgi:hypothetical protein